MASITFALEVSEGGSLAIPQDAVETLALQPGDEITVRIETGNGFTSSDQHLQAELHRRAARLIEAGDRLVREPGKPLGDAYEAAWAAGVEEKARKTGIRL